MASTNEQLIKRALELYKPPFKYDKRGTMIWDANMQHVLDIRNWGHIQYLDDAEALQDTIGEMVAELLNKKWEDSTNDEIKPGDKVKLKESSWHYKHYPEKQFEFVNQDKHMANIKYGCKGNMTSICVLFNDIIKL